MQETTYPVSRVVWQQTLPRSGIGFDWLMALLSAWFVGGFYLDVWAHHNLPGLETFFTPWHGVLYSGFFALTGVLAATLIRNALRGASWQHALPAGYGLSLFGGLIFLAGGVGDMIWHTLFGIEVDIEALLSPTHLMLFLGGSLLVSGPLRAAWIRSAAEEAQGWKGRLPLLLSLTFLLSVFTGVTEYGNPFTNPWPALSRQTSPIDLGRALGIVSIVVQTGLLLGLVFLAVRRWRLPFGSLTLVMTLNIALTVIPHGEYRFIPVAFLAGLAADLLFGWLQPSADRPRATRLFAFVVPTILYALYFAALALGGGTSWSIPLWSGGILLAGTTGWLVSYLAVPPVAPASHG